MVSDGDVASSPGSDNTTPAGENMTQEDALIARLVSENSPDTTPEGTANQQGGTGRGPRRPSNAFILYRKDKQALVKEAYPNILNNEICKFQVSKHSAFYTNNLAAVFVAALWKNETELVQNCYKRAANILRDQFLAIHPGYRYNPRRPEDIPRRTRRGTKRSPVKVSRRGPDGRLGVPISIPGSIPGRMPTIPIDPSNPLGSILPREVLTALPISGKVIVSQTAPVKFRGNSVTYPLAPDVQDIIRARFPGTTHVVQGPVETTLVAELPHMTAPMVTAVIRNENLEAIYAAAAAQQHNGEVSFVEDHSGSDQMLFPTESVPFTPENNEAQQAFDFHDGLGPGAVNDLDFLNENI